MAADTTCEHGQGPYDRRCVTECFGATREGPQTMIARCMLCGACRTYRVIDHAGPVIEYGPWRMEAHGN
jgi:hypothetical protein